MMNRNLYLDDSTQRHENEDWTHLQFLSAETTISQLPRTPTISMREDKSQNDNSLLAPLSLSVQFYPSNRPGCNLSTSSDHRYLQATADLLRLRQWPARRAGSNVWAVSSGWYPVPANEKGNMKVWAYRTGRPDRTRGWYRETTRDTPLSPETPSIASNTVFTKFPLSLSLDLSSSSLRPSNQTG